MTFCAANALLTQCSTTVAVAILSDSLDIHLSCPVRKQYITKDKERNQQHHLKVIETPEIAICHQLVNEILFEMLFLIDLLIGKN